jgi:integration host factor subunit alpha
MTRDDLTRIVSDFTGATTPVAHATVSRILGDIGKALGRGEEVNLYGFGRFSVSVQGPRPGHNPHTGEKMEIGETHRVKFKAHGKLRDAIIPADTRQAA